MAPESYHTAAREMLMLEHTRWKDHLLLFLGIIGSAFIGTQYVKDVVPTHLVFAFSSFISLLWLCAVLANRSTTNAWYRTVQEIEAAPTTGAFTFYQKKRNEFSLWRDFASHFGLVPENGKSTRALHLFDSVTRIYITLSFALFLTFTWLAFRSSLQVDSALETKLGKQLIERDIRLFAPDATLLELYGPTESNRQFQAHLKSSDGRHQILRWETDSLGRIVDRPHSP
jgi:hypothetical protein